MKASHSTNLFTNSCDHISTNRKAPLHSHINLQLLYSKSFMVVIQLLSTRLKTNFFLFRFGFVKGEFMNLPFRAERQKN